MDTRLRLFSVIFLAALTPLFGQSEAESPAQPADKTTLVSEDLVRVDALVTDSKGVHVSDLALEEFELRDSGKKQEITHIEYVSTGSAPTASVEPAPPGHPGAPALTEASLVKRSILLVVNTTANPALLPSVRDMLRNFADHQMQSGDLVALRTSWGDQSVLGGFTGDRSQLRAAINGIEWTAAAAPMWATANYQALHSALAGIREMPGRKAVVYISPNLTWPIPALGTASARNRAVNESHSQIADLALRAGAVFYLLDPSGPGPISNEIEPRKVPSSTGGSYLHGSKDLSGYLETILDELTGYYLISYRPPHDFSESEQTTFHKFQVKVKRKGASVRSRSGYYEVADGPATTPEAGNQRLSAALFSPLSTGDLRFQMNPLYVAGGKDAGTGMRPTILRTLFAVDPASLPFTDQPDGTKSMRLEMLAIAQQADGSIATRNSAAYMLNMSPEQLRSLDGKSLLYQVALTIDEPGPYVVRAAMTDSAMETVGAAQAFVDIPDFNSPDLSLSTLVAVETGQEPLPAERGAELAPGNSIQRVFRAGSSVRYMCTAIGAKLDGATGVPNLESEIRLYQGNQRVFASQPVPASADGSTDEVILDGTITLPEELPVGDYVMELVASERLADAQQPAVSQWIRFTLAR